VDAELSELLNAIQVHGFLSREQAAKAVAFAEAADKRSFELEEHPKIPILIDVTSTPLTVHRINS
jgi:hypothetical protein